MQIQDEVTPSKHEKCYACSLINSDKEKYVIL